jgi:hypothetical protein
MDAGLCQYWVRGKREGNAQNEDESTSIHDSCLSHHLEVFGEITTYPHILPAETSARGAVRKLESVPLYKIAHFGRKSGQKNVEISRQSCDGRDLAYRSKTLMIAAVAPPVRLTGKFARGRQLPPLIASAVHCPVTQTR